MAVNYRLVEHWAAGEDYTRDRRDLWLLEPDGLWMTTWAIRFRRGGLGKPIEHHVYDDEQAARYAMAARMEQCRNEPAGADWQQVP